MKVSGKTILGNHLPHLLASLRGKRLAQKCASYEQPLRSELFSADQMAQHGKTLAGLHTLDGVEQHDKAIPLVDDRQEHSVEVRIHAAGS